MESNTSNTGDAEKRSPIAPLLEIKDLHISFTDEINKRELEAVRGFNLTIYPGQSVAIVGESGSGKSTSAHAIIDLLPGTGKVTKGSIKLNGKELVGLSKKDYYEIRGNKIGLIPQDPMSNLNPVLSVQYQISETLKANNVDVSREKRLIVEKVKDLLDDEDMKDYFVSKKEHREAINEDDNLLVIDADDDQLFISSENYDAFIDAVCVELRKQDLSDDKYKEIVDEMREGMRYAYTTKGAARKYLEARGIANAKELTDKYFTGCTLEDRIVGLCEEAGLGGMKTDSKNFPHELSGGMCQRILIAIGLAARPQLIIADEPTSALDVTVQKKILDKLQELISELGTTLLFITHDLGLAADRAEHIVVMYKGKIVEQGSAKEILTNPQHPYTKKLIAAAPSLNSERMWSGKEKLERAEELKNKDKEYEVLQKDLLVIDHVTKEFPVRGDKNKTLKAVDDVSFTVNWGKTFGVVGESGSGKSTVAKMVLGLHKPTSGRILFNGQDIGKMNKRQLLAFRRHVQPVFQNPYGSLDPMYTIFSSLAEPLRIHGIGDKKFKENRVKELIDMVQLPQSVMTRYPNELSGGQRQRITVARAIALQPDLIICDEAVSALDVLVQDQILHLLNDLQTQLGFTYLFITHDLAVVKEVCDEVVVMQFGKIVEQGEVATVFNNPQKEYTQNLLDAIPGRSIL